MLIGRPSHILRLLAFLLFQSCMLQLAASQSSGNFTNQSALIAFKSKLISGPNETTLAGNWSATANFCDWIGVSCSRRRQRVTGFNFSLSLSLQFNFVTIFQKDNVGITISPTVPHRPPPVSIIFQNCLCLKHFCVKPRFPIKLYIYTI
jgi:hypothetical protein